MTKAQTTDSAFGVGALGGPDQLCGTGPADLQLLCQLGEGEVLVPAQLRGCLGPHERCIADGPVEQVAQLPRALDGFPRIESANSREGGRDRSTHVTQFAPHAGNGTRIDQGIPWTLCRGVYTVRCVAPPTQRSSNHTTEDRK